MKYKNYFITAFILSCIYLAFSLALTVFIVGKLREYMEFQKKEHIKVKNWVDNICKDGVISFSYDGIKISATCN